MSNTVRVQPDLKFVQELQQVGGESLKKCYQCATCSVVCPLSPPDGPYPRKEMVWAQWGLKDRLVNDIDIWLCHNCGTCSDLCPRGAKPGDLLSALRNMAYRNLAKPSIIGKWMSSAAGFPLLMLIPAVIYGLIWSIMAGKLGTAFPLFVTDGHGLKVAAEGAIIYGGLFPGDYTIDPIFGAVFVFMALAFAGGIANMLKGFETLPKTYIVGRGKEPSFLSCLIDTLKVEVAQHSRFQNCGKEEKDVQRFTGHLFVFYAFIALMVVTSVVAVGHWFGAFFLQHILGLEGGLAGLIAWAGHTPMPLWSPVKLLANAGAVALVYGLMKLTSRRTALDSAKSTSNWYDWYLLTVIWGIALTGIGSEIFRLIGQKMLAYPTYYLHLIFVFMMLAYLPWSKLGHVVYRTVALAYARKIGRLPMGEI
ncbi:MAG: quinone-interacting membrane-bound oxidoreductase complex subunit QmoC [Humidesulfovibrio sp.]|uniref:quinone-interacting membrane-bound oxidoreductase complex subunit QmoC n=1 Tax=Humidesulfovibrio sp. TaxID=2910988 RepID=UPI0027E92CB8|nr:quinone-interacting membrane-bound oxidoreductase complex subunit QmoC [Humidesulfovibrio sp.]MDQ7836400.1 quinone-interacting membrane-bound oxidoreductase complex subunit QmoC [Humidesulfovibrio sp.]